MTVGVINNWDNLTVTGLVAVDSLEVNGVAISGTAFSGAVTATSLNVTMGTPASAAATGVAGTIKFDSDYIYVCVATNTWKRVAVATW